MPIFLFLLVLAFSFQAHAIASNPNSDYPYEIIGADPLASDLELSLAWRAAVKAHHPDRGGTDEDVHKIIVAGHFLRDHRVLYDRRLLPFRGIYKPAETRVVPISQEEITKFQITFLEYMRAEPEARGLIGSDSDDHPAALFYGILNLRGDHGDYGSFQPAQLRAYRELIYHIDLLRLTKFEVAAIVLNDPVQALDRLLEYYDNFNVKQRTLNDLFWSYNQFYVSDIEKSRDLIELIGIMERSHQLYEPRFAAVRPTIVTSLKLWLNQFYYELPRAERREIQDIYIEARRSILRLEPLSSYIRDCGRLMTGRRLKP